MNLVFINSVDIPFGGAQSMLVSLLIKGLRENSVNAFLIIPYGEKREHLKGNKHNYGHFDGVPYYIVGKRGVHNKFISFIQKTIAILCTSFIIYKRSRKNVIHGVILGGMPDLLRDSPLIITCLILGIPVYPWFVERMSLDEDYVGVTGFLNRFSQRLTERILPQVSTGVIVISTLLKIFYQKYCPDGRILLSPILVRGERNVQNRNIERNEEWIDHEKKFVLVYSGSFAEKDGVHYLIDAFNELRMKYSNLLFIMTGNNYNTSIMKRVLKHIDHLGLKDQIKLMGFVDSEKLRYYTNIANILFVCRTNSLFANYGFPFKLGEYAMTGKPIIASRVSDIGRYFTDNEDIFLVEPNSSNDIAEKVDYILSHYETALCIARKGMGTASKNFNYFDRAKEMTDFIRKNYNDKKARNVGVKKQPQQC